MVKVYGKANGCGNCESAKAQLKKNGIEFEFIDVMSDSEGLALIKSLGYRQVPVMEYEGDWFTLKDIDDLIFMLKG